MAAQTILIAEDDPDIRDGVRILLAGEGYHILEAENGTRALEIFNPEVDLVILDIMMPGESGNDILDKLHKSPQYKSLPVIMLTAKTSEYDIVKGLDGGADDYVCKPFGIVELISRIRAVLRRSTRQSTETNVYTYGLVTLDQEKHTVSVDGKPCHLTVKEFELLRYLLVNTDIVLKREQIMEAVWGFTYEGESRTIDMHIKSLRQKLGDGGKIIHTVRGVGYVIGGGL